MVERWLWFTGLRERQKRSYSWIHGDDSLLRGKMGKEMCELVGRPKSRLVKVWGEDEH